MLKIPRVMVFSGLAFAAALLGGANDAKPFRDLNHNGVLDPYEDSRAPTDVRVADLLARMTVEEKVGATLHGTLPGIDSPFGASSLGYDLVATRRLVADRHITSMISRLAMEPSAFARQNNAVQLLAQQTRLGIPVTISSDPRNHFSAIAGASVAATGFSQWPEPLGFGALDDPGLVRRFGSIAAQEYRAVGLHMALSPQADLASDPRWSRALATFGADPAKVSVLAAAYVEGFQGSRSGLRRHGVAAAVKHWAGYGATPDGFDAHNYYGRTVRVTDRSFKAHLAAFAGPLAVRAAGVMPTYAIVDGAAVDGQGLEPVGAGFSGQLINGLLRQGSGFRGLVVSDWGIINDCPEVCRHPTAVAPQTFAEIGMPWGVEELSRQQRVAKAINAGVDQFGGFEDPAPVLDAVRNGLIPLAVLDDAVRRVLTIKFELGLFDDPFVDERAAAEIVGKASSRAEALDAQEKSLVILKKDRSVFPLRPGKVWAYGFDSGALRNAGLEVVGEPLDADVALLRISAPFERLHPHHFFGAFQHEGRLDFRDGDPGLAALRRVAGRVPTITVVDLDRAAILGEFQHGSSVLIGSFGASDTAVLNVLLGKARARGRLPIELPRNWDAVNRQRADRSNDSVRPLYPAGWGL